MTLGSCNLAFLRKQVCTQYELDQYDLRIIDLGKKNYMLCMHCVLRTDNGTIFFVQVIKAIRISIETINSMKKKQLQLKGQQSEQARHQVPRNRTNILFYL